MSGSQDAPMTEAQPFVSELPEGYKMTPLGPLPAHWQVVRLGEVGEIITGRTPSTEIEEYWNGSIPFITPVDLVGTPVRTAQRTITEEGLRVSRPLPRGSVLVSCIGYIGKVGVVDTDVAVTNQQINAIIPKAAENWYVAYAVMRLTTSLESHARMTTVPILSKRNFEQIPIPLPPLPEQRAIAHVLRTVQRAQEATERVIAALKQLEQSLMRHLFTYGPIPIGQVDRVPLQDTALGPLPAHWQVVRLGEVVEKTGQVNPEQRPDWRFKYIDVSSIDNDGLRIMSYREVLGRESPSRARKLIKEGDVLFATVRPYLKRVALVPCHLDGNICSTAFCVLRAYTGQADPRYLFYAVSRDEFVESVSEHQRGSSYPAVTDSDVLRENIPLPPLSEQRAIADTLQTVDRKLAAEEQRRAALHTLFRTLLHELMTARRRLPPDFIAAFAAPTRTGDPDGAALP